MNNIILTHSLSAAGTIKRFLINGGLSAFNSVLGSFDDFSHGPIPDIKYAKEFIDTRINYWRSINLYENSDFSEADPALSYFEEFLEAANSDQVEFWTSGTVQDTFFVIVYSKLLLLEGYDAEKIVVREFAKEKPILSLGVLKESEISGLYASSAARRIDVETYTEAWIALSSGRSDVISSFVANEGSMTLLGGAFAAFLKRFPECNGGIGSIDQRLLKAGSEKMRGSAYTIGSALTSGVEERDYIGDLFLFHRMIELSQVTNPWFFMEGDLRSMRTSSAKLTPEGVSIRKQM